MQPKEYTEPFQIITQRPFHNYFNLMLVQCNSLCARDTLYFSLARLHAIKSNGFFFLFRCLFKHHIISFCPVCCCWCLRSIRLYNAYAVLNTHAVKIVIIIPFYFLLLPIVYRVSWIWGISHIKMHQKYDRIYRSLLVLRTFPWSTFFFLVVAVSAAAAAAVGSLRVLAMPRNGTGSEIQKHKQIQTIRDSTTGMNADCYLPHWS